MHRDIFKIQDGVAIVEKRNCELVNLIVNLIFLKSKSVLAQRCVFQVVC